MRTRSARREAVIKRLSGHLLETGLARTSLRQLAAAAGVSDRMLLYYFEDKDEVLRCVIAALAADLVQVLGQEDQPGMGGFEGFVARAAQATRSPALRPFMRLWIDIVAAAGRGEAPYVEAARTIGAMFLDWIGGHVDTADPELRAAYAGMAFALVDGLALLEICAGEAAAEAAACATADMRLSSASRSGDAD